MWHGRVPTEKAERYRDFLQSMAAIHGFAGDDVQVARYYPEDRDYLLEFEAQVVHYDVVGRA